MFRHVEGGSDIVAQPDAGGAAPEGSAQAWLRQVTRPWHDAVEAAFAPFDLATAEGLAGFLRRHATAVPAIEHGLEVAGVAQLVPDWAARRRRNALLADLRTLGLPEPGPVVPLPVPSAAHAWGCLYVLEGSRLGGRVLLRRVLASPDPAVRAAVAFLGHAHPGTWGQFAARLDASGTGTAWRAGLRAGAEAAFTTFAAAAGVHLLTNPFQAPTTTPLVHFTHA